MLSCLMSCLFLQSVLVFAAQLADIRGSPLFQLRMIAFIPSLQPDQGFDLPAAN